MVRKLKHIIYQPMERSYIAIIYLLALEARMDTARSITILPIPTLNGRAIELSHISSLILLPTMYPWQGCMPLLPKHRIVKGRM